MKEIITYLYRNYFEIAAFSVGLLLLALMDPKTASGPGLCLLENLGFQYCPGDGLGHSISFIIRGEFDNALEANILGPFALIVLSGRVFYLFSKNYLNHNNKIE
ncbi:DUF2752 domain-containing protein [Fodinibius sp.]|uniref:DUF2752 domain-containing protein n=1 Tax=Fodinibius sp. TaxID=1872440 RepID=UPI002ACEDE98|nr:DUF2752 domain-containing protein [Fodinibius sp.]MDZ7660273.1 DUF2752 domain-containing protein [Fodinibius sp.]